MCPHEDNAEEGMKPARKLMWAVLDIGSSKIGAIGELTSGVSVSRGVAPKKDTGAA